jgi:hypothetical protein
VKDVPKATHAAVKEDLDGSDTSHRSLGVISQEDVLGRCWAV